MAVIVYSFDVDETLEISNGPIKLQSLMDLRVAGHIVGICGNMQKICTVPGWQHLISFLGQGRMPKELFLYGLKENIPADDYVHIGNRKGRQNSLGFVCGSEDDVAAARAGWRFLLEDEFAAGAR